VGRDYDITGNIPGDPGTAHTNKSVKKEVVKEEKATQKALDEIAEAAAIVESETPKKSHHKVKE
jgi:hypothetical protein